MAKPAAGPRVAKLLFQIEGRPFPLPLVEGTIAGKRTRMLVDTGANSHVIAGWFARASGLSMEGLGDVGTDHVGKSIATFRVEHAPIALDGWGDLPEGTVLATEVPEVIERLGIGAFVSPQRLLDDAEAVVMDLPAGELRAGDAAARSALLASPGNALVTDAPPRLCEENEGPVRGLAFVMRATINERPAELLLDTGAQISDVFASSPIGKKLAPASVVNPDAMYTASGKIQARRLPKAVLRTGDVRVVTDLDILPVGAGDTTCPRDGVLAMDLLRTCALVFSAPAPTRTPRVDGRCAEPPPPPALPARAAEPAPAPARRPAGRTPGR